MADLFTKTAVTFAVPRLGFNILGLIIYHFFTLLPLIAYGLFRSRGCVRSDLLSLIIVAMDLVSELCFT